VIGDTRVWLVRSQEGAITPGGVFATLSSAIGIVRPAAVILVGTAMGLDPATQQLSDILIARQIVDYEPQRIGTAPDGTLHVIPRSDRASASTLALDRCNDAVLHGPAERARVRFGLLLSGEKLLEHAPTAAALLEHEPEALDAEQEGVALYTAAHQHKLDWIVIKVVARWPESAPADILLAARNVAEFTVQMIQSSSTTPCACSSPTLASHRCATPRSSTTPRTACCSGASAGAGSLSTACCWTISPA
jgi:nucleoside phosphorylase